MLIRVASREPMDGHMMVDQILTVGERDYGVRLTELSRGVSHPSRHAGLLVVRWLGRVPEHMVEETRTYLDDAARVSGESTIEVDPED